jgi:hypothetical protein
MKSVCGVSKAWKPDVDFPYEKHETSAISGHQAGL